MHALMRGGRPASLVRGGGGGGGGAGAKLFPSARRAPLRMHALPPDEPVDDGGMGLADLLERDRKSTIDLSRAVAAFGSDSDGDDESGGGGGGGAAPERQAAAAAAAGATTAAAAAATPLRARADRQRAAAAVADGGSSSSSSGGANTKAKRIKARRAAAAAADTNGSGSAANSVAPGPRRCKEAIDLGVAALGAGDADGAVALFTLALELPGNGAFRLPGRAREYSCPSDAEEAACLYNMACAFASKGALDAAAECLEAACDDAGFEAWDTMLADPDLRPLGEPRLRAIADARRGAGKAVKGFLSALPRLGGGGGEGEGGGEVKVTDLKGKPWIMW